MQWSIAIRERTRQAGSTLSSTDEWFRQERSTFKAVMQVGARGWGRLKPILLYLRRLSNKSHFTILTTMAGPTGASKIILEGAKGFIASPKKVHNTNQAGPWGRKRR